MSYGTCLTEPESRNIPVRAKLSERGGVGRALELLLREGYRTTSNPGFHLRQLKPCRHLFCVKTSFTLAGVCPDSNCYILLKNYRLWCTDKTSQDKTSQGTKRSKTKRPKTKGPRTKRFKRQNVPWTKRPKDKTSQRTKHPKAQNVIL